MYRNYNESNNKIRETYKKMLQNQTLENVQLCKKNLIENQPYKVNIWDLLIKLNTIVDDSDPDTNLPQIIHLHQTAQSIKNNYIYHDYKLFDIPIKKLFSNEEWCQLPEKYQLLYNTTIPKLYKHITDWRWFILVGFIHDLGKILLLPEYGNNPQWKVVGDTFPLGAKLSKNYPFYNENYHINNPDLIIDTFINNTGFDNMIFSWGHDEYLAKILELNNTNLPKEAIYIIRYHSFYSWHSPSTNIRGYTNIASEKDWFMLPLLKCFQKSDLYSKSNIIPSMEYIKQNYNYLFDIYIPNKDLNIYSCF